MEEVIELKLDLQDKVENNKIKKDLILKLDRSQYKQNKIY